MYVMATKLTSEITNRIATVIRAGGTIELAASVSAVTPRTIYAWLERGTRGGKREAQCRALREAVDQARAEREVTLLVQMNRAAARGSWRASAWILERTNPARWGPPAHRPRLAPQPVDPLDALDELAARRPARPPL
jgi:hypothetical protein